MKDNIMRRVVGWSKQRDGHQPVTMWGEVLAVAPFTAIVRNVNSTSKQERHLIKLADIHTVCSESRSRSFDVDCRFVPA